MKKTQIHIARNGQLLGVYDSDKIADYVEMGTLKSTDHFFEEKSGAWKTSSEWHNDPSRARSQKTCQHLVGGGRPKSTSSEGHSRRSSRSHRSKKNNVAPWLISLLSLCVVRDCSLGPSTSTTRSTSCGRKPHAKETQRTLKLENQVSMR